MTRTDLAPRPLSLLSYILLIAAGTVPGCAMGEDGTAGGRESPSAFTGDASATDSTTAGDSAGSNTGGGTGTDTTDSGSSDGELAVQVQALFGAKCGGCHGPGAGAGGIDDITDLAALVVQGEVDRYSPETSEVYLRVTATDDATRMPKPPSEPLDDAEIDLIRRWILAGAPATATPANCLDNPFISLDEMIEGMAADLFNFDDPVEKSNIRYLTLTHLHNSGVCGEVLDEYEAAISKLLNSLSREPSIARPVRVGPHATILRIDLRDYGWDDNPVLSAQGFDDAWEATVIASPVAVEYRGGKADTLKSFAATAVPFQSADSFLQIVSRGELYYDLLQLPATVAELEADLGVPLVSDSLKAGQIARAAFKDSGVSSSNRMIERREVGFGGGRAYWRSYDFAGNSDSSNLFAEPLFFEEDGGEIIFNLENELQAYMLFDADGNRVDVAPTTIVRDPAQSDSVVKNGISCMACHEAGIIPKADEFFDFFQDTDVKAGFTEDEIDLIKKLFPGNDVIAQVQAEDAETFKDAMWEAGVELGGKEPIIAASLAFEADVDLGRAAAELGVTKERLDQNLNRLDLSLRPLRTTTIPRDTFTSQFRVALCVLRPGDEVFPVCPDAQ